MNLLKEAKTGLVKVGSSQFGKALLGAAAEANRKSQETALVGRVSEILVQIQKQEQYIDQSNENIRILRKKVKAIEDGKFSLSPYGHITFDDDELHKEQPRMPECVNCGYPTSKR